MNVFNYYYSNVLKNETIEELEKNKDLAIKIKDKLIKSSYIYKKRFSEKIEKELLKRIEKSIIDESILVVIDDSNLLSSFGELFNDNDKVHYFNSNLSVDKILEEIKLLEETNFHILYLAQDNEMSALVFRLLRNVLKRQSADALDKITVLVDEDSKYIDYIREEKYYYLSFKSHDELLISSLVILLSYLGKDEKSFLKGIEEEKEDFVRSDFKDNKVLIYSLIRYCLFNKGINKELVICFNEKLKPLIEYFKMLFNDYSRNNVYYDLISVNEIKRSMKFDDVFETFILVNKAEGDLILGIEDKDLDDLNYLFGRKLSYLNKTLETAISIKHSENNISNSIISLDRMDEEALGHLYMFLTLVSKVSRSLFDIDDKGIDYIDSFKKIIL